MASPLPDGTRSTQPQNLDLSQCYLHPIPVTKEFDLVVYRSPSLTWTLTSSTTLGEDCPAKERMSQLEEGELRIAFKNLRTRIPQNFAFQQLQQVKVGVTSLIPARVMRNVHAVIKSITKLNSTVAMRSRGVLHRSEPRYVPSSSHSVAASASIVSPLFQTARSALHDRSPRLQSPLPLLKKPAFCDVAHCALHSHLPPLHSQTRQQPSKSPLREEKTAPMKSFTVALIAGVVALAASVVDVAANPHPYTLPDRFPAGEPIESVSSELQLESLESVTSLESVAQQIERCNRYNFAAKRDGVYLNGAPFYIKGANFFGMETEIFVPHGLWGGNDSTTIQNVATLLKANNFNTVRIPLVVDAVLRNVEIDRYVIINEAELQAKFEGKTIHYFDVLDHVINVFAKNKILVLLDAHVLVAGGGITPLWYTSDADKTWFEDAWKILATRYKNAWNVIGADLKNEPHDEASWGSNDNKTDWRLASLQMATSILKINPRWLIFVEGMQLSSRDDPEFPCFWGENLMDVQRAQLKLPVAERLVYSPHVYGPNVYGQPYFKDPTFPANMPAIWDSHFGFVKKYGAMVVGEWGGKFRAEDDITWQRAFAQYLKDKKLGWLYWCVNPNSGDTEGLLENDWNTPRYDKLTLLSIFQGSRVP